LEETLRSLLVEALVSGYRALWAADVHISNTLPFAVRKEGVYTDRLDDTTGVVAYMAQYAKENGIRDLWFIGDLIDKRLMDAPTLKSTMETLLDTLDRDDGVNIHLIPGNHEAHDARGETFTLQALNGIRPNLKVWTEHDILHPIPGLTIRGCPYKPDEEARDVVSRIRDTMEGSTVMLLHQSLVGGRVGAWVNEHGIKVDDLDGFLGVLAGHFHTPQQVAPRVNYLGAPMQHNFGDAGEERGFWDIVITDGKAKPFAKMVKVPRMATFHEVNWTDIQSGALDENAFNADNYYHIRLEGSTLDLKREQPAVQEYVNRIKAAINPRYVKALPIVLTARAKERAKVTTAGSVGGVSWPAAVTGYLDACDVSGLSRARLEAIARTALEEAEH
jgi:DNA repair exonuclease SbcCD nuclease subunit